MKFNTAVSSSRRKSRKAHFGAPSSERRRIMSARLDKSLRTKYNVKTVPLRKDDEVRVVRGTHKSEAGKVICCYRKHLVIHIERLTTDKLNGQQVPIPIDPSNVVITKLKMDNNNRRQIIERRNTAPTVAKGKYTDADTDMKDVD
eukprot:EC692746.1.p1 GENE.EC692746.1~~EC692746.1.p1  ORF type:complete len:165 (+),score=84.86 EC692746.1:63-497(+)